MNTHYLHRFIIIMMLCNPILSSASLKQPSHKKCTDKNIAVLGTITSIAIFTLISAYTAVEVHNDVSFSNYRFPVPNRPQAPSTESNFKEDIASKSLNEKWYKIGAASCQGKQHTTFPIPKKYLQAYENGREYCFKNQKKARKAQLLSRNPVQQKTKK